MSGDDFEEKLIMEVEVRSILYNKRLKIYSNLAAVWDEIARNLQVEGEFFCISFYIITSMIITINNDNYILQQKYAAAIKNINISICCHF